MNEAEAHQLLVSASGCEFVAALQQVLRAYRRNGWLSIDQAAKLADMSTRSLQRALAAEGCSYYEVVDATRAELASEMLRNKDISLDEIAKELGYSSHTNFSRAFQRWTGKSPTEFRRGQP